MAKHQDGTRKYVEGSARLRCKEDVQGSGGGCPGFTSWTNGYRPPPATSPPPTRCRGVGTPPSLPCAPSLYQRPWQSSKGVNKRKKENKIFQVLGFPCSPGFATRDLDAHWQRNIKDKGGNQQKAPQIQSNHSGAIAGAGAIAARPIARRPFGPHLVITTWKK